MTLQFGFTAELANTGYAPLAALLNYYQGEKVLDPLQSTLTSDENKLIQVILSILSGCETMSMVNTRLRPERVWAQVNRIEYFADQSTLSRYLNSLRPFQETESRFMWESARWSQTIFQGR